MITIPDFKKKLKVFFVPIKGISNTRRQVERKMKVNLNYSFSQHRN